MNVASSFCITRMVISTCDALHPSADARPAAKKGGGDTFAFWTRYQSSGNLFIM